MEKIPIIKKKEAAPALKQIKTLGTRVVIKTTMTKKKTVIIVPGQDDKQFDITNKVIYVSPYCDSELEVGMIPVFAEHARAIATRVVINEEDVRIVTEGIYHFDDIVGYVTENDVDYE